MNKIRFKKIQINKQLKKVILSGLLVFAVLFSYLSFFKNNIISSTFSKLFLADNETVDLDHWELSTVFYDSTVDGGTTPLTEINWDASDGGYGTGQARTITVQINYKNTNTVTDYDVGELTITIPNLCYYSENSGQSDVEYNYGINDDSHVGFDWKLSSYPTSQLLKISNQFKIEKSVNLEGSIQLKYKITPRGEYSYKSSAYPKVEYKHDDCLHTFNINVKAILNNEIFSNNTSYTYQRQYIHPWVYKQFEIEKKANKISSYDRLGDFPANYIWVKYTIEGDIETTHSYPLILLNEDYEYVDDSIPQDCVVFDKDGNKMTREDGNYIFPASYMVSKDLMHPTVRVATFYVGFPKSVYHDDNLNITNHVYLRGTYYDETERKILAEDNLTINLSDYNYSFPGQLYSISKTMDSNRSANAQGKMYYQGIIGQDDELLNSDLALLYAKAIYTGKPMDVIIGDDVLFIQDENGNYRRLLDDEYFFKNVKVSNFYNMNGQSFSASKYDGELWVRYKDSNEFIKYGEAKNTTFSENEKVVGYYILLKNVKESVITYYRSDHYDLSSHWRLSAQIAFTCDKNHIKSYSGNIYNYSYLQVFINDELQNAVEYSDYVNNDLKSMITEYDLNQYGRYVQRSFNLSNYINYSVPEQAFTMYVSKAMNYILQNAEEEKFMGQSKIHFYLNSNKGITKHVLTNYYLNSNHLLTVKGWNLYDLLPDGMTLESSERDIIDNLQLANNRNYPLNSKYFIGDSNGHFFTTDELLQLIKDNTRVEIIHNYHNSGRTYIHVVTDLTEQPIVMTEEVISSSSSRQGINIIDYIYDFSISYDSYFERGSMWNNRVFADYLIDKVDGTQPYYYGSSGQFDISRVSSSAYLNKYDDGEYDFDKYDFDEIDINNNGDASEYISGYNSSMKISSIISSNQDVQVSVQSDKSNFDTGKVESSNDSEYVYKLRARTGSNDITNLVIYDSLEKYAKDSNMEMVLANDGRKSWNGEFLGIDTSYAESKGYVIRSYYSENEEVGSLKDDSSWKLYTDSVDKSKVKSLAFEYLDSEGNAAIIPANSLTYVLVRMKSPSEELKTFAYNGCWTEWNAIDSVTGNPVDFITGINSNIVKVGLPSSVEPEDVEISIDKYWNDHNNSKGMRPSTVSIKVVPDGDYSKAIDVSLGESNVDTNNHNHWNTHVTVPKYDDDGNRIQYSLEEVPIELDGYCYIPEINDYSITNTLNQTIQVTKKWLDNQNQYGTRPNSITIQLFRNNSHYKDLVLTGNYVSDWEKEIHVPVFATNGEEYLYSFKEITVNHYMTHYDESSNTFTNILSEDTSIQITKEWFDRDNQYHTRPESIQVKILRNGEVYKTVSLTGSTNVWNSESISVPKYDENGALYQYTILEESNDSYGFVEYDQEQFKIKNTLRQNMDLIITKNWIDSNNEYHTRPNHLKVTIYQNGLEYQEVTLNGDDNTCISSIEVPKYDENQEEYQYTVKESNEDIILEYSDIVYDGTTITNKLSKSQNILISKKWIDYSNQYKTRPESLKITLYQNNNIYQVIDMSGSGDTWSKELTDIPVYDENGKKYSYVIKEEEDVVHSKYSKITYDQTNFTITNELTEIPKVTLYFTVKNGYTNGDSSNILFDDYGLKSIMNKYNLDSNSEYIYKFELRNEDTGKIYEGKLSTLGVLEFEDIPYGTYRAVEVDDQYFDFVSMLSIEDVPGVQFKQDSRGGLIIISPTGKDIIYGANIINKINSPIINPKTGRNILFIFEVLLLVVLTLCYIRYEKNRKRI